MIRLVDEKNQCEGRAEVIHSGTWDTACDDLWGIEDAHVVRWQLACGKGLSALEEWPLWRGRGEHLPG